MNPSRELLLDEQTMWAALDDEGLLGEAFSPFLLFWLTCFPHYQEYGPAEYQPALIADLEDLTISNLNVMGFRESAKSTLATMAYAIYAGVTKQAKFIIISSDTDTQSQLMLLNIRMEFEENETLKEKHGPFRMKGGEWGKESFVLANGVRYMTRSRGEKFRSLRHRQHRPELVIVDDPEDRKWVRKKANRDETQKWIQGDVIGGMSKRGRLIVLSNMLHPDCLGMRLKKNPAFLTREYPLIKDGKCQWKAKYPTKADLKAVMDRVGRTAWLREYLLKVVPDEGQIIKPEWIIKYDKIPAEFRRMMEITGIDLAISEKSTADYTAMVSVTAGLLNGVPKIYVRRDPVHDRMSMQDTVSRAQLLQKAIPSSSFYCEDVGYQKAAIEMMRKSWVNVKGVHPIGDKRARLETVSPLIQSGTVEFADVGNEDLLSEILNFGIEEHDDLLDALVYALLAVLERGIHEKLVTWI